MLNEGLKPPISKWEGKMGAVVFVQQLDLLLPQPSGITGASSDLAPGSQSW